MAEQTLQCWQCGASLANEPLPLSRHANCEVCFAPLHCCRQCQHYAPKSVQGCLEERAEPPREADNANFCEYLIPAASSAVSDASSTVDAAAAARAKLDALFLQADSDNPESKPE
ncbi:MAG: hypothetical protein ACR2PZ_17880 [Pseudomonadales bacterium]